MATAVQPEKILKELANLWASMAKGDSQGVNSGVLRACAMTLVVAAEDDRDAQQVGETLAELMHEHPSRAIVLRPGSAGALDARVFAQCWMPFGKRQQICCEQIEITAAPERLAEIPGVILGIMAPDLPLVLWVRSRQWLEAKEFARIYPLVHKLVVDSRQLGPDPFPWLRQLDEPVNLVADLAWTRLSALRETLSFFFEDYGLLPRLREMRRIEVDYHEQGTAAAYLAAWLLLAQPDARVVLRRVEGGPGRIWLEGPGLDLRIDLSPTVLFRLDSLEHRAVLPRPTECSLMREELSILEVDPVYQAVCATAERLIAE
jgi:hypothetical protein